jgi:hypothetical protein
MASILAECKVCGQSCAADQFRLHFKYKQMVCPNCYNGRTEKKLEKERVQKETPAKPPGWDKEDEYLEKMSRLKRDENQAQFSKIPGTNQVQCKCLQCKYSFKYDPFRKSPRSCPYCDADIPKLRTFNLL